MSGRLRSRGVHASVLVALFVTLACGAPSHSDRADGDAPQAATGNLPLPIAAAAEAPRPVPAPVRGLPADAAQLVMVTAGGSTATTAALEAWQRDASGGWRRVQGPVQVKVGTAGIGAASEASTRTPAGTFPLTEAFGRASDPGTGLRYRRVDDSDWWVSDASSPRYNTRQRCAPGSCEFDEDVSENLYQAGAGYDHAVVIGYNLPPARPGAGSAFFVHVDAGIPSAGCVVVPRTAMIRLLRWLDADQRPVITIAGG